MGEYMTIAQTESALWQTPFVVFNGTWDACFGSHIIIRNGKLSDGALCRAIYRVYPGCYIEQVFRRADVESVLGDSARMDEGDE